MFSIKSSLKHDFLKKFMSFEMVPNSFEFDFEQISFNPLESADGKIFQNDRDSDLNYFHEINIPSKERTYINETDIKIFYMRHKDLRTFLFFMLT